eukprot:gene4596-6779_t
MNRIKIIHSNAKYATLHFVTSVFRPSISSFSSFSHISNSTIPSFVKSTHLLSLRSFTKTPPVLFAISREFHSTSTISNTHYEILGVSSSAPPEDIKKAYIDLSKRLHPDTTVNLSRKEQDKARQQYHRVSEAYSVLSKPLERRIYDSTIGNGLSNSSGPAPAYAAPSYQYRDIYDNVHFGESPYKIFSNTTIVFFAVVWMLIGIVWHYFAIAKTKTELEKHLERLSREAAVEHAAARRRARENGYKKQLEILVARSKAYDDIY